jgi:hypothetical protein
MTATMERPRTLSPTTTEDDCSEPRPPQGHWPQAHAERPRYRRHWAIVAGLLLLGALAVATATADAEDTPANHDVTVATEVPEDGVEPARPDGTPDRVAGIGDGLTGPMTGTTLAEHREDICSRLPQPSLVCADEETP